jgi:hypothetical protein
MKYNPEIHCRHSIRLQGYDYSNQCAYFVTICSWSRENILGDVLDSVMQLTSFGEIAMKCWQDLPDHYRNIETVITFLHLIDKQVKARMINSYSIDDIRMKSTDPHSSWLFNFT